MSSSPAMGANLFSSPPPKPGNGMNDPHAPKPPPFPTITPKRIPKPALKSPHSRTKYHKPVPESGVVSVSGDRSVVVGDSGVSYLLPGAPFEFQFSYSETPKVKPLAFREPAFLPFAPPTMPRPWTGKAPLKSKKEKELKRQKKVRLLQPFGQESSDDDHKLHLEMAKKVELGQYHLSANNKRRSREEILGQPLTRAEVQALLKPCLSRNRQVNLGRDGLTHNMLELIHSHWRRDEICKVRCRGVPTVDMDNVCYHLQEKTGGKIIYRVGGIVYLFRGRHYDPRTRPRYPIMLWKPATPVYPKLIQEAPEGLTKLEADDMRSKGRKLLPISKLAKNGIYLTLVKDVRDAFEGSPLVKINCQGLDASDYKRIGAKLKDLVPCVLLSFDEESILMWRGKDWKSRYLKPIAKLRTCDESKSTKEQPPKKKDVPSPRMMQLWNKAIESKRALLLDESPLSPDALLEKVEEFEGVSQALEHSYKALILPNDEGTNAPEECEDISDTEIIDNIQDEKDYSIDSDSDCFDEFDSNIPYGLMPVDAIAKDLTLDFE